MTPHERLTACMNYRPTDRPPLWEWGPWPSTLERWQREGLGEDERPPELQECDAKGWVGVDQWMRPRYETHLLAEDERTVTRRTEFGVVMRELKTPDTIFMPQHMDWPVRSRTDWRELKSRFDPDDPGRFPPDWSDRCRDWRTRGPVVDFHGRRMPSLFGFVREIMGPERALTSFYDDPVLVEDIMEHMTCFYEGLLNRILDDAPLTCISFWEDMCYRNGPLISPAMFRQYMSPRYRRITELARGRGVEVIMVDSDGDVDQLIPLWIESGVNCIYPMEVAAGMDVVALRRKYGRDLRMTGGIDKRVLAWDKRAIDAELSAKLPLAEDGGYIPHLDHAIPDDVPYKNFVYYWRRKKERLGIG